MPAKSEKCRRVCRHSVTNNNTEVVEISNKNVPEVDDVVATDTAHSSASINNSSVLSQSSSSSFTSFLGGTDSKVEFNNCSFSFKN